MSNQLYTKVVYPSGKVRYLPIAYLPSEALGEGVWLVEREGGSRRSLNLSFLFDLPPKPNQVAFARRIDDIAQAVLKSWNEYREKGSQSPMDVAKNIVKILAEIDEEDPIF